MPSFLKQIKTLRGERRRGLRPHHLLIMGYAVTIVTGTLVLRLPESSAAGAPLDLLAAFFTATSATCVTGLTVIDVGTDLSRFGQAVILVLFQLGGLGIMTFSTLLLFAVRTRPSMLTIEATGESFGSAHSRELRMIVLSVVAFTFAVELIGFGLLLVFFSSAQGGPTGEAVWSAAFHAVSAYCNAGFSLHSDSLVRYSDSWPVGLTVMAIIVIGGIGWPVIRDVGRYLRRRSYGEPIRITLHSKVVLIATAALLLAGTLGFLATEWSRPTLSESPVHERLLKALFQSVTCRTAGFNTVSVSRLAPATVFMMIGLMFIGAAPASTGGGMKTSTFGILIILAISRLRGREHPSAFGRAIQPQSVVRALTVFQVSLLLVLVFPWLMMVAEGDRFNFSHVLFEAVSAFGTVGLSTGITADLTAISKVMLCALMFVGRLGPLTLVVAIARRERPDLIQYPSEPMLVG